MPLVRTREIYGKYLEDLAHISKYRSANTEKPENTREPVTIYYLRRFGELTLEEYQPLEAESLIRLADEINFSRSVLTENAVRFVIGASNSRLIEDIPLEEVDLSQLVNGDRVMLMAAVARVVSTRFSNHFTQGFFLTTTSPTLNRDTPIQTIANLPYDDSINDVTGALEKLFAPAKIDRTAYTLALEVDEC
jgi:hypothetical protein